MQKSSKTAQGAKLHKGLQGDSFQNAAKWGATKPAWRMALETPRADALLQPCAPPRCAVKRVPVGRPCRTAEWNPSLEVLPTITMVKHFQQVQDTNWSAPKMPWAARWAQKNALCEKLLEKPRGCELPKSCHMEIEKKPEGWTALKNPKISQIAWACGIPEQTQQVKKIKNIKKKEKRKRKKEKSSPAKISRMQSSQNSPGSELPTHSEKLPKNKCWRRTHKKKTTRPN